ncbi:MAG: hypothetical protein ABSA58_03700 [Acetobacteraceae bacterium]
MSRPRPATTPAPGRTLICDPLVFREKFDREHFLLEHTLASEPVFQLPRLVELASATAASRPADVYYDAGDIGIGQRWDTATSGSLPVDETIRNIETQGAWIVLWRAEQDPAYAKLLNRVMSDILELAGHELERLIKKREVILFITSPNRVTSYHIDRECNFLLQIQGRKQISVFRREDRDVLPEEEIERFWTTDHNAPAYREALQDHADEFTLEPGNGIHIPVNGPHWLRNGDNVSISASFNFQFHDSVRADLYRANYFLRKFGLHPAPPFKGGGHDALKQPFGAAIYKARQLYRGRGPRD